MFEWKVVRDGLPLLLAAACLLITATYASFLRKQSPKSKLNPLLVALETRNGHQDVPEIDGNRLYYGRTKWPQYEARFNLKLSHLYGDVIVVKSRPTTFLQRFERSLNKWLCHGWHYPDTTILINSLSDNEEALKKLFGSCASRAPSIAAGKYLSRGRRIVLQPYGPDWVRHRRAFASLLTKERINNRWTKALRAEAMVMVDRIANLSLREGDSGTALLDEISRFTASSVLQITYARRASTPEDPILRDLEAVSKNIADAFTPGKYWVDEFPMLDIFPSIMSPWKRKLNANHFFELGVFSRLIFDVEMKLDGKGADKRVSTANYQRSTCQSAIDVEDCGAAELLRNREQLQLDRDDIAYLAAGIFEAGTETTAMTITTFMLAAASYPEITRRAQDEIDQYMDNKTGDSQEHPAPTFEDLQHLPYLAALVKEALRLTPTGSSGVAHTPTRAQPQCLELKSNDGGRIRKLHVPRGATILANTYGLHHDSKKFPNPWRFNPDRWLISSKPYEEIPARSLDHTHANFAFGFGRRICPGSTLASYTLSISIALLLWCFDFLMTDKAQMHCVELEKQERGEAQAWTDLFPKGGQRCDVLERQRVMKETDKDEDDSDRIGRVLIDAHIAFKLSRRHSAECIRLEPRKSHPGLQAVRMAMGTIEGRYNNS